MNPNVVTLARWLAKNAVKLELRAQGRRPDYEEIGEAVRAYFAEHREALIEEAKAHPALLGR
jgi:translation initiation factor IF-3